MNNLTTSESPALESNGKRKTIALVEDDIVIGEAFSDSVGQSKSCKLQAWYDSVDSAIDGIDANPPDVVFVDLKLPDGHGAEIIATFQELNPAHPQFIVYTMYADDDNLFEALQAGANGYLIKGESSPRSIDETVAMLEEGSPPLSGPVARRFFEYFRDVAAAKEKIELPPRPYEVLELLSEGFSVKQIADRLGISEHTVNDHRKKIYKTLHVNNRTSAIRMFLRRRVKKKR